MIKSLFFIFVFTFQFLTNYNSHKQPYKNKINPMKERFNTDIKYTSKTGHC